MNSTNWRVLRDSIDQQLDTLMILRFRKEVDSMNNNQLEVQSDQVEVHASFGPQ